MTKLSAKWRNHLSIWLVTNNPGYLKIMNVSKSYSIKAWLHIFFLSVSCHAVWVILSQMSRTELTFSPSSWPNSRAQRLHSHLRALFPPKAPQKQHVWHRAGIPIHTHIPSFSCLHRWADLIHCAHCDSFHRACRSSTELPHVLWVSQAVYSTLQAPRRMRNTYSPAFRVLRIIIEPA